MSKKYQNIKVLDNNITVTGDNYISLTDMLKAKDGDFFISDWLRNRNTVEYLGIWERIHNPIFNYGEFAIIKNQAGLNNYKISVKEWVQNSPKPIFRIANENNLFASDISIWLNYADARIGTSHDYSSDKAETAINLMPDFIDDAIGLYQTMTEKSWE